MLVLVLQQNGVLYVPSSVRTSFDSDRGRDGRPLLVQIQKVSSWEHTITTALLDISVHRVRIRLLSVSNPSAYPPAGYRTPTWQIYAVRCDPMSSNGQCPASHSATRSA